MNKPVNNNLKQLIYDKGYRYVLEDIQIEGGILRAAHSLAESRWNKGDVSYIDNLTIAEVVMWLYEKHGIWIYPLPIDDDMKLWQVRIIKGEPFSKLSNTLKIISHGEISYRNIYSPTEAYEAAIKYYLENLV